MSGYNAASQSRHTVVKTSLPIRKRMSDRVGRANTLVVYTTTTRLLILYNKKEEKTKLESLQMHRVLR